LRYSLLLSNLHWTAIGGYANVQSSDKVDVGGAKAVAALESVFQEQELDGAFSLIHREALARVKARLHQ
jgi:hypothetical protein